MLPPRSLATLFLPGFSRRIGFLVTLEGESARPLGSNILIQIADSILTGIWGMSAKFRGAHFSLAITGGASDHWTAA
jgi:hypothetical protein